MILKAYSVSKQRRGAQNEIIDSLFNLFYEQLWSKMVVYGFIDNIYSFVKKVLKEYFG